MDLVISNLNNYCSLNGYNEAQTQNSIAFNNTLELTVYDAQYIVNIIALKLSHV